MTAKRGILLTLGVYFATVLAILGVAVCVCLALGRPLAEAPSGANVLVGWVALGFVVGHAGAERWRDE